MSAPTIYTPQTGSTSSAGTSHSVTLPASIAAGDLLVLVFQNYDDAITASATGWTQDHTHSYTLIDPTLRVTQLSKTAVGGETSITVTTSSSTTANWIVYRIANGAIGSVSADAQGTGNSPDPAPFSTPESPVDSIYLLAVGGWENDVSLTSYPSTYTIGQATARVSGGSGSGVASAMKLAIATEDTGNFVLSGSAQWVAYTQVIEYAAGDIDAALEAGTLTLTGGDINAGAIVATLEPGTLSLAAGNTLTTVYDPTYLEAGTLSLTAATNFACLQGTLNQIKKIDMTASVFDLAVIPPANMQEGDFFGFVIVAAGSRSVTADFTAYPTPANLTARGDSWLVRYINGEYFIYTRAS